jgi:hypothetical protein
VRERPAPLAFGALLISSCISDRTAENGARLPRVFGVVQAFQQGKIMSTVFERVAFRSLRPLASTRCLDASLRVAADQLWGASDYALAAGEQSDHDRLVALAREVFEIIATLEPETQRLELHALLKRYRVFPALALKTVPIEA